MSSMHLIARTVTNPARGEARLGMPKLMIACMGIAIMFKTSALHQQKGKTQ